MKKEIQVSIIIPCFNDGERLPDLLDSIMQQNIKELEVIVADGGSEQSYENIIAHYKNAGLDIQLITSKNRSYPLQSRLAGADIARGEAIFFADCDDILIGNEALKTHVELLLNNNLDIVNFHTMIITQTDSGETHELSPDIGLGSSLNGYSIFRTYLRTKHSYPNLWSKIFSRRLCKKLIPIPLLNHPKFFGAEDRLFTTLAMFYAESYKSSPIIGYGYKYRDNKPLDWVPKAIGSYYIMLQELIPYLREVGCQEDDCKILTNKLKERLTYYTKIYTKEYISREYEIIPEDFVNNLIKYYPIDITLKSLIISHPIHTYKSLIKREKQLKDTTNELRKQFRIYHI